MVTILLGQKCGTTGSRAHIYLKAHGMYLKMLPSDGGIHREAISRRKVNHVYLLNHAFFLFSCGGQSTYRMKSPIQTTCTNHKHLPTIKADPKIVFGYLTIMGKARNSIGITWHTNVCYYQRVLPAIISHTVAASVWVSDHSHMDWGQENREGVLKLPIINDGENF